MREKFFEFKIIIIRGLSLFAWFFEKEDATTKGGSL